jgi:HK97 family phage portal protein
MHSSRMLATSAAPVAGFEAQMRALETNGTLYAIVQRTIEAVAEVQWCLYRVPRDGRRRYNHGYSGAQETRTEVVRHPALDLWNQPNPFHTGHAFREMTQQYQEVTGEQYWVVTKQGSLPTEMWPVRPDRMFPVPHPTKFLAGWIYRSPDGEEVPLAVEDVIFLRNPRPLNIYRGLSPVQAIHTDLDATRQASEYTSNWFRNGAAPGGIIQAEQNISDEDFDQLQARWRETHQGVSNTNRVAILEAGMTWSNVHVTHDDMQLVELKEAARETIREAFGFPKAMMGATDDVNKANAYAGEVLFARWVVKPRLIRIREALNRFLLPMYGSSAAGLEFDFVNPVPEDDEIAADVLLNKAQAANFLAATGLWEAQSITEVCGLPDMAELPEPRAPQIPASTNRPGTPPAAKPEQPAQPQQEPPGDPEDWLQRMLLR